MTYLLQSAFDPAVPQASPCRCILNRSRSAARREDWTGELCAAILPFIGNIEPLQPEHQNIGSIGSFALAATQSAAQAATAIGLLNSATSGLMSVVSTSSFQSGSISVI